MKRPHDRFAGGRGERGITLGMPGRIRKAGESMAAAGTRYEVSTTVALGALARRRRQAMCADVEYQSAAKKWHVVPASTNRCHAKCRYGAFESKMNTTAPAV